MLFFHFCRQNIQNCEFVIVKNVNFEWLINCRITIAKVANLLGVGTWVPAVKSNNFAAGTLQA